MFITFPGILLLVCRNTIDFCVLLNSDGSGSCSFSLSCFGLKEKGFNLSLLSMMLAVGLAYIVFILLNYVPLVPNLLRVLK